MAEGYDPSVPVGDSSSPDAYAEPAENVAVDEKFQLQLNAAKIAFWGFLLLCTAVYAIRRRYDVSRAWKLFYLLIGVLTLTFLVGLGVPSVSVETRTIFVILAPVKDATGPMPRVNISTFDAECSSCHLTHSVD